MTMVWRQRRVHQRQVFSTLPSTTALATIRLPHRACSNLHLMTRWVIPLSPPSPLGWPPRAKTLILSSLWERDRLPRTMPAVSVWPTAPQCTARILSRNRLLSPLLLLNWKIISSLLLSCPVTTWRLNKTILTM